MEKMRESRRYAPFRVRGLALGEGLPKICVPLVARSEDEIQAQLAQIQAGPYDLVEWRADYLPGGTDAETVMNVLAGIRAELGEAALLFTFRTKQEGGEQEIPAKDYASVCMAAASCGLADLIDVEYHMGEALLGTLIPGLHARKAGVVCSCHDFGRTPDAGEMVRILSRMQQTGADVTKLAVMPRSRADVLALLEASVAMEEEHADRPFITMSMGRLGSLSRLAGSLDGSALTFAAAGRASAPGQMGAQGVREALALLG